MTENRLPEYIEHMRQAAVEACGFVEGYSQEQFLADKRTQQAVIMSLIVIGEAATQVMDRYEKFAESHPDVQWRGMRGMRNRIAHGYFDIDLEIVWDTVRTALPDLLNHLQGIDANELG